MELPMPIADALVIFSNSLNSQYAIPLVQKPRIELVIWNDEPEENPGCSCEQTSNKENNLPCRECSTVFSDTNGNAIGDKTAKNLCPAVEGEPEGCPQALLFFGVPLRCEEGKACSRPR